MVTITVNWAIIARQTAACRYWLAGPAFSAARRWSRFPRVTTTALPCARMARWLPGDATTRVNWATTARQTVACRYWLTGPAFSGARRWSRFRRVATTVLPCARMARWRPGETTTGVNWATIAPQTAACRYWLAGPAFSAARRWLRFPRVAATALPCARMERSLPGEATPGANWATAARQTAACRYWLAGPAFSAARRWLRFPRVAATALPCARMAWWRPGETTTSVNWATTARQITACRYWLAGQEPSVGRRWSRFRLVVVATVSHCARTERSRHGEPKRALVVRF